LRVIQKHFVMYRLFRLALRVLVMFTFVLAFSSCRNDDRPGDDNNRTETNNSKLPGNENPEEYTVTPTLKTDADSVRAIDSTSRTMTR
jgi:hypothetical protein